MTDSYRDPDPPPSPDEDAEYRSRTQVELAEKLSAVCRILEELDFDDTIEVLKAYVALCGHRMVVRPSPVVEDQEEDEDD